MILMLSGRTDIIAFYYPWFIHRMKEGYVDSQNPFNPLQINRYYFKDVEALLVCTKNPLPIVDNPAPLLEIPSIIHVTITPYGKDMEPNVPRKMEVIEAVKKLSALFGKERIVVRYDPILLNDKYTIKQHGQSFRNLVDMLHNDVDRFIISFVADYKNTNAHHIYSLNDKQKEAIGEVFEATIKQYGVRVETCAQAIDLTRYGIHQGQCLSQKDMDGLLKEHFEWEIDEEKRQECRCIATRDIGAYNSCMHYCRYCYANYDEKQIRKQVALHNQKSSLLVGELTGREKINVVKNSPRKLMLF